MTTLPPAPYSSQADLAEAIMYDGELMQTLLNEDPSALITAALSERTYMETGFAVQAVLEAVAATHARHLWETQAHNYRASASELRDAYKQNEAMDARRAA